MNYNRLSVLVLILVIVDASRSSEVHQSVHDNAVLNSDVLNKKLLPDIKHLLKENCDGNRQKFLHLLSSLEVDGYKFVNDAPFTIIIPKFTFDAANMDKTSLQQMIFEHVIPGVQIKALKIGEVYGNLNHNNVEIKSLSPGRWTINDVNVLNFNSLSAKLISFVDIDGYLNDRRNNFAKRNIQEHNSYNEPEKLVQKEASKSDVKEIKDSKVGLLQSYLSTMKSGTKVFQHFLSTSNLSQVFEDTSSNYIILVPSDSAFQRWHPIDWGFYPFSVPDFTENIMRNHVIQQKQPFILKNVEKEQKMKAIGGEYVVFRNAPMPMVNNVTIDSNVTLPNGNDVYIISEVLFMTDSKVSKLHQLNKDKETPPLLAFPWFGSQFLSHAFLALERDNRFTQITKFLNSAEIASSIIGSNYTFFVPFDDAFEKYGFDELPDEMLSSERSSKLILNHFVKGRLYNRDLLNDEVYETVGGKPLRITRDTAGHVSVNRAKIAESEVFVYNLGTMFYIDDILYPEVLQKDVKPITQEPIDTQKEEHESSEEFYTTEMPLYSEKEEKITTKSNREPTTPEYKSILSALLTTRSDVELIPSQFTEFEDAENGEFVVTPRALPLRYEAAPPK